MKTDPARAEQDEEILRLRCAGLSLRAIAARVGLSHQGVSDRITAVLAQLVTPAAEEYRALETVRLDTYLEALSLRIGEGDYRSVGTAVRISERRAKLLGLDSPVQLDVAMKQRLDLEASVVGEVIGEVVNSVSDALAGVLSVQQKKDLFDYSLAVVQWKLLQVGEQDPGPRPVAPVLVGAVPGRDLVADYRAFCAAEGVDPDEGLDDEEDDDGE
jgi:hypothetical protein